MNKLTKTDICRLLFALIMAGMIMACGNDKKNTVSNTETHPTAETNNPEEPVFSSDLFDDSSATVDNPYYPLKPGTMKRYEGENEDGEMERIEISISHETREIDGVESTIVIDRAYIDGELLEETFDWFAQDMEGNVWYMGEASADYEDGEIVSTQGSWESGLDVADVGSTAVAGIIMKNNFVVGDQYIQESYPGEAEDTAQIEAVDVDITLSDGTIYSTVQIREWNPLDSESQDEFKYFAPDIGFVVEENEDGTERKELIESYDQASPDMGIENFSSPNDIDNPYFPLVPGTVYTYEIETEEGLERIVVEVLSDTREVMGITSVVVRDLVTLDGVVIEDTYDWYAQDNDGNVWYMGEDVDNYNYDEDGALIDIDHEGAWEAGVDGAQPGILMPANPRVGDSYRQEYLVGEAEDLAAISALGVEITLSDGSEYTTLRVREWNPLDEDSNEYKYFAEGIGLVREEEIDEDVVVDLIEYVPAE